MALAHRFRARNVERYMADDEYNVSPFHDPRSSQFGIHANSVGSVDDSYVPPRPSDPPGRGTPADLRGKRHYNLRGSFNRSNSTPARPSQADAPAPPPMLDTDPEEDVDGEAEETEK